MACKINKSVLAVVNKRAKRALFIDCADFFQWTEQIILQLKNMRVIRMQGEREAEKTSFTRCAYTVVSHQLCLILPLHHHLAEVYKV